MHRSLSLHVADRLETLWARLGEHLKHAVGTVGDGGGIPVPPWVVVPSPVLGEWLQVQAARSAGVSLGVRFASPGEFWGAVGSVGETERRLAEACRVWSPDSLRWRLLPEVAQVAGQLGFADAESIAPRERLAVAELLATELDRTLRFRPGWVRNWRQDKPALKGGNVAEGWQRELWLRLAKFEGMSLHPAELVLDGQACEGGNADGKPKVFFVAVGEVEPLALQTLRWLAGRGWAVELHVLLPSVGYLGDLPSRHARRKKISSDEALPGVDDSEGIHPLLVSLGQQSAGVFLQLGDLDDDYSAWPEAEASAPVGGTESVLSRLQARVRGNAIGTPEKVSSPEDDFSLRVHECHGPRRELEVLRDELLRAFHDDDTLRPEQVRVAAVNFDVYAPLAEAVLKRPAPGLPNGIPVRLTAVAAREANPVLVALLQWMRLALGRQSASELLELLSLDAVKHRLGMAEDAELHARVLERVRASGLTHGLGQEGEDGEGTWLAARDRVSAGFWFGLVEAGVELPARGADGGGAEQTQRLHPVAAVLAEDETLGSRLADWWLELETRLREGMTLAPAREWATRLRAVVDGLFRCAEVEEAAVACLRWVADLDNVTATEALDVGAVLDWLSPRLDNATSLRTTLDGSVLFGRLEQIRGLPCRVLAILGLQDEAFPRADRRPAWSLLAQQPERWDPEARRRDRQLFLDLVLAPTRRLILTASNRNRRTSHDGPLSACVEDLLRAAAAEAGSAVAANATARWRVKHALQPFAAGYFSRDKDDADAEASRVLPRSFDTMSAETATLMATPQTKADGAKSGQFYVSESDQCEMTEPGAGKNLPQRDETRELTLEALISFWKDPAKGWLKALGVAGDEDEADDETLDDAPLALDGLQSYKLSDKILRSRLGLEAKPEAVLARLAADRGLAPGALGKLRWARGEAELSGLTTVLPAYVRNAQALRIEHVFKIKDAKYGLDFSCRLTGEVQVLQQVEGEAGPRVLSYRPGNYHKDDDSKYRLAAWISTLAQAVASDATTGGLICGTKLDLQGAVEKRTGFVDTKHAGEWLQILILGYWVGQTRPLPFAPETSVALAKELRKNSADETAVLEKAEAAWVRDGNYGSTGEGLSDAAQLAWRGRDPFAGADGAEWIAWANLIAAPLDAWWSSSAASPSADAPADGGADKAPAAEKPAGSSVKKSAKTKKA